MHHIHWTRIERTIMGESYLGYEATIKGDGYLVHREGETWRASVRCEPIGHTYDTYLLGIEACHRHAGLERGIRYTFDQGDAPEQPDIKQQLRLAQWGRTARLFS